jgi:hypothetical protein
VKLVAPIKTLPSNDSDAPDARPLGVGECLRRAINTALLADLKPACADYFWPQQVAVGVPGGISLLVFGVRALLEQNPGWVAVRIDIRNAYNEIKRTAALRRLNDSEQLRCLVPLFWATHAVRS